MRNILAGAGMVVAMAGPVLAGSETVTLPVEEYQAILKRLDALQQRVEVLEAKPAVAPVEEKRVVKVEQDVKTIYEGMDEIETRQLQDKINFGIELRTRVDTYVLKDYLADGENEHDSNNWINRFRINMDTEFAETLSFHGRLAMYKNWGDSDDATASGLLNDANRVHQPNSSNLWVDRAYVDWIPKGLPVPVAVTIGRQPSTEGPPFEFKENRLRQSTYPALLFNGESDGVVATLGLERYTGIAEMGLRFGYSKFYHSDEDNAASAFPFLDDSEAGDSNVFGFLFESELPGLPDSLAVLSLAKVRDLPVNMIGPVFDEAAGVPANMDLGDMKIWGAHLQARNLFSSGVDLFFSYGGNQGRPNGNASLPSGGLLSFDGLETRTGSAIYTGGRYAIPFEPLNLPRVGFEFNHGSRYWFSMTMGATDIFNKLATRGDVYDLYYIQPINQYLFFRAGYMHVSYDYTGSGMYVGEPVAANVDLDNYYLLMDVRF